MAITQPYASVDIFDEARMRAASDSYRAGAGELPAMDELFRDDRRHWIGLRPKPRLDGRGIMRHMCRRCHNPDLDPLVSRALFDVDRLDSLDRFEKDEAIRRLTMPSASGRRMPPPRFGRLSDAETSAVVAELRK